MLEPEASANHFKMLPKSDTEHQGQSEGGTLKTAMQGLAPWQAEYRELKQTALLSKHPVSWLIQQGQVSRLLQLIHISSSSLHLHYSSLLLLPIFDLRLALSKPYSTQQQRTRWAIWKVERGQVMWGGCSLCIKKFEKLLTALTEASRAGWYGKDCSKRNWALPTCQTYLTMKHLFTPRFDRHILPCCTKLRMHCARISYLSLFMSSIAT